MYLEEKLSNYKIAGLCFLGIQQLCIHTQSHVYQVAQVFYAARMIFELLLFELYSHRLPAHDPPVSPSPGGIPFSHWSWMTRGVTYILALSATRFSDLDGHHRHTVYDGTLPHPFALTIFEDTIFWTDWNTRTIEKGNKYDGSNRVVLANTTHRPFDIHVYHPYRQPIGESLIMGLRVVATIELQLKLLVLF